MSDLVDIVIDAGVLLAFGTFVLVTASIFTGVL